MQFLCNYNNHNIYSYGPEDLKKHIERLLTRVNKIELISQILLENAPNVVICVSNISNSNILITYKL